jgi:hypothetical protein
MVLVVFVETCLRIQRPKICSLVGIPVPQKIQVSVGLRDMAKTHEKDETEIREEATLKRLLSTPPTPHKAKPESPPAANPKKRGRPAKERHE